MNKRFLAFRQQQRYLQASLNRENPVLTLFRLITLVLTLSFLTVTANIDLGIGGPGASPIKYSIAAMEDGPEGEEAPLATFVRSFDGDDLIGTGFVFAALSVRCLGSVCRAEQAPPPSHSACAGYPTGPPAV